MQHFTAQVLKGYRIPGLTVCSKMLIKICNLQPYVMHIITPGNLAQS